MGEATSRLVLQPNSQRPMKRFQSLADERDGNDFSSLSRGVNLPDSAEASATILKRRAMLLQDWMLCNGVSHATVGISQPAHSMIQQSSRQIFDSDTVSQHIRVVGNGSLRNSSP